MELSTSQIGSQRSRPKSVDSQGHSYVVKKHSQSGMTYWKQVQIIHISIDDTGTSVEYKLVPIGSQRSRPKPVDSQGHSYMVKKHSHSGTTYSR